MGPVWSSNGPKPATDRPQITQTHPSPRTLPCTKVISKTFQNFENYFENFQKTGARRIRRRRVWGPFGTSLEPAGPEDPGFEFIYTKLIQIRGLRPLPAWSTAGPGDPGFELIYTKCRIQWLQFEVIEDLSGSFGDDLGPVWGSNGSKPATDRPQITQTHPSPRNLPCTKVISKTFQNCEFRKLF